MAELTEEQKIIIGVCVGVAGIILLAIIIFICCVFYRRDRRYHHRSHRRPKERLIDRDYYHERRPYNVYEKTVPPPYEPDYYPPPPPPPALMPLPPPRREIYYNKPRSVEVLHYNDEWSEPAPKRYYSENRWDIAPKSEPIVIPLAEPEYVSSGDRPIRGEGETIYLKYVDDQALLPRTNYSRRYEYSSAYGAPLRRSRSYHDIRRTTDLRRSQPYVGEWGRQPENLQFNEYALRAGRDPFLWR